MRILLGFLLTSVAAAQPCPEVGVTIEMTAPALIESTEGGEFVTRALLPGDQREVLELVTEGGREQVRLKGGWCFCDEMQWRVVAKPPHVQVMRIRGGAELIAPRQEFVPVIRPVARMVAPRVRSQAPVQAERKIPADHIVVEGVEYEPGESEGPRQSWIAVNWPHAQAPRQSGELVGLEWVAPARQGKRTVRGHWRNPRAK